MTAGHQPVALGREVVAQARHRVVGHGQARPAGDHDQAGDQARVGPGHLQGGRAAERVADEHPWGVDLLQGLGQRRAEDVDVVEGHALRVARAGRGRGTPPGGLRTGSQRR